MNKIMSLTPEQESLLPQWRDEWLRVGLCTDPANRQVAEAAITQMYACIGKAAPRFVWADSPLTAHVMMHLLSDGKNLTWNLWQNLGKSLQENLRQSIWQNLTWNLRESIEESLAESLQENLQENLWHNLQENLWETMGVTLRVNIQENLTWNLWQNLGENIAGNIVENFTRSLHDSLRGIRYQYTFFWGQHDAYWIAYYRFAEKVIGICYKEEAAAKIRIHEDVARSCMWWWPFENVCVVSNRPSSIHRDSEGRLHNPNGAAVTFRDGWKTYALHGIRITNPDWLEDRSLLTVQRVLSEENAEVRRLMLDIYTPERFIQDTNARKIDASPFGELWVAPIPDDEPLTMVRVTNSTAEPDGSYKNYWLRVPPKIKTAKEAVAWTYWLKPEEYAPIAES